MTLSIWSQEKASTDRMYTSAREEAFEHKIIKAIGLMEDVTQKATENVDYAIFLGRLYTWDKQTDKARSILGATFDLNAEYEDAALAYASLEFWNQDSEKALKIVDTGLQSLPDSESLLVLKAKILMDLKRNQEASKTLNTALGYHPKSTNVRSLLQNMATSENLNEVGLSYNFVHFKERFDQPWHLASLHYGRQTGIGPVFRRLNYGNRVFIRQYFKQHTVK